MKLALDPEFLKWFSAWSGKFEWDEGNLCKNEKRGATNFETSVADDKEKRRPYFMKSSKKKSKTSTSKNLEEFEKKDLGETLKTFKSAGRWIKPKTKPTSIALPEETIQILREKASRKGIGYQTLLKIIVQEHLNEY